MGFIKDKKASILASDAQAAWDAGRAVYTPVLNFPMTSHGFSGGNDDIALMTEAILSVGWKLDTWAAVTDKNGKPQIMPLFVRPGQPVR
ncbi:hypothetical protein JTF08_13645 [Micrococcaceae bacterium RIT802]|nr:hypothetical protein [Micrococcaceae bacterium RIT 802]